MLPESENNGYTALTNLIEGGVSESLGGFQKEVRAFVDGTVRPQAVDAYEKGEFPSSWLSEIKKSGWFALAIPEEYGGHDCSYQKYAILCSELERGDSGVRSLVSVHCSLAMQAILRYGSEAQKKRYLPAMARGEIIGCFSLTEPESGSDPSSMRTIAKVQKNGKDGKDGYVLQGHKMWATNATIADIAIVFAKLDGTVRGFILEKDDPGFEARSIDGKGSLRISKSAEIILSNCSIASDRILPGTEVGIAAPLSCLTMARSSVAHGAIGAARHCFELAREYCLTRKQFDKPLASFQLVQDKLVRCYKAILQAQLLNSRLIEVIDEKKNNSGYLTLANIKELTPFISLCKQTSCSVARQVTADCRDLLGAVGILVNYEIIRHMGNIESIYTYEGTDHIHTLILGKELTGINAFA